MRVRLVRADYAAAVWEEGDAAARRGEYDAALSLFDHGRSESPDGEALWHIHTAMCCLYRGELEVGVHRAGAGLRKPWAQGAFGAQLLAVRALCQAAVGRLGHAGDDVARARKLADGEARSLSVIARAAGTLALVQGDPQAAQVAFEQALGLAESGASWEQSDAHNNLAWALLELGDLPAARHYLDLAETDKRQTDDAWGLAYLLYLRARCSLALGSIIEAIGLCRAGFIFAERVDDPRIESALLVKLGHLAALNGDFATARSSAEEGIALARRCGAVPELIEATLVLADTDLLAGALAEAQGRARWAVARATAHGIERGVAAAQVAEALASFRPTDAVVSAAMRWAASFSNPFERMEAEVRLLWWQARHGIAPDTREVARLLDETRRRGAMRLHALCRVTENREVAGECEAIVRLLGCNPEADQIGVLVDARIGAA